MRHHSPVLLRCPSPSSHRPRYPEHQRVRLMSADAPDHLPRLATTAGSHHQAGLMRASVPSLRRCGSLVTSIRMAPIRDIEHRSRARPGAGHMLAHAALMRRSHTPEELAASSRRAIERSTRWSPAPCLACLPPCDGDAGRDKTDLRQAARRDASRVRRRLSTGNRRDRILRPAGRSSYRRVALSPFVTHLEKADVEIDAKTKSQLC